MRTSNPAASAASSRRPFFSRDPETGNAAGQRFFHNDKLPQKCLADQRTALSDPGFPTVTADTQLAARAFPIQRIVQQLFHVGLVGKPLFSGQVARKSYVGFGQTDGYRT